MKPPSHSYRPMKAIVALLLCLGSAGWQGGCPCFPQFGDLGSLVGMANDEVGTTVTAGEEVNLTAAITPGLLLPAGSEALWTQVSPALPEVGLEQQSGDLTVFAAPSVATTTTFTFRVTAGSFMADTVEVIVLPGEEDAPREIPVFDMQVAEGDIVLLDGFGVIDASVFDTDSFDPTTHQAIWRRTSPVTPRLRMNLDARPDNLFAAFIAEFHPTPGPGPIALQFRLDIFDAAGDLADPETSVAAAIVNVNVRRHPIADAGPYQYVLRPQRTSVQLDGSGSVNVQEPGNDAGLTFVWTQIEGPAVQLSGPLTATPGFSLAPLAANRNHRLVFAMVAASGAIPVGPIRAASSLEAVEAAVTGLLADVATVEVAVANR